jgi:hypothetical protein
MAARQAGKWTLSIFTFLQGMVSRILGLFKCFYFLFSEHIELNQSSDSQA